MPRTYKEAGVDIEKGEKTIQNIKEMVLSTHNKNVLNGLGGFSSFYEIPKGYQNPVIVSGTDGVGTKLKIAIETGILDSVGIDLVAMCVNDIITCGAKPLFFLDYLATGKLSEKEFSNIISGIVQGCELAGISLVGGETAEMPGMYLKNDFDLAGFASGIIEKKDIIDGSMLKEGDVIYALPSSGLHSNGYSLVRYVIEKDMGISLNELYKRYPDLLNMIMRPTVIYSKKIQSLMKKIDINTMAHITGGGIKGNLERVIQESLDVHIERSSLPKLEIYKILANYIDEEEMYKVFNMGAGYIIGISENDCRRIEDDKDLIRIGKVKNGNGKVEYV